ncbi:MULTISPECIES: LysR substrate-binding domain-containing protein [Brucella/Ochrobactrum group]|uniref:Transcriptional regulator, LysR family n=2 Tax=Brucella TaxID=234 RepID=A6X639_BRUA4|nr:MULTISPECIES: LysR substrate-binding domain-containing protein [Brucella/Ochrobactrum group]ABS16693.1 transcriptional regulator, LysR family [Brucella anthropi ATCC 49188]AIK41464.1 bacterial regulatory helix-turn-helix, lysR family protein [Brucella anthropi]KAB2706163.1 LysR family transcriptional regulator [Brucella lupini]KAB2725944.1 LysR family transcriptional regulator [Brucella anthropi]KAB2741539.1 LysR family transcriptional regulator [Brucella anthropi]
MSSIHNIDLNLIRVFNALMEERNVTKAGERLNLTQSAVSHALGKLRYILSDELFVRGPQGMHPTPRAEELSQPLRSALADISAALSPVQFDPATADMSFVVATSDFYIGTLFPAVMERLEKEAPGIRLWLRLFNDLNLVEELDRGTLHLVVGAFGRIPSRFRRETLVSVDNVWIMRKDHPASSGPLTIETLGHYPHIDVLLSGRAAMEAAGMQEQEGLERAFVTSNPPFLEGLLREVGLSRRIGATVSLILAVPPLVAATNMIALLPRSVAETYKDTYGLVLHEAPYPLPATQINMLSHNTFGAHPAVAWLRSVLREAITVSQA